MLMVVMMLMPVLMLMLMLMLVLVQMFMLVLMQMFMLMLMFMLVLMLVLVLMLLLFTRAAATMSMQLFCHVSSLYLFLPFIVSFFSLSLAKLRHVFCNRVAFKGLLKVKR